MNFIRVGLIGLFLGLFILIVTSCKKDDDVKIPTVETNVVTDIINNFAMGNGSVTDDGGSTVFDRGICWSTTPNPIASNYNSHAEDAGTGDFSVKMLDLNPDTKYYVRAFAENKAGIAYGNEVDFTTLSTSDMTRIGWDKDDDDEELDFSLIDKINILIRINIEAQERLVYFKVTERFFKTDGSVEDVLLSILHFDGSQTTHSYTFNKDYEENNFEGISRIDLIFEVLDINDKMTTKVYTLMKK